MSDDELPITSELLLQAYARGYFPMAASRDDPTLRWYDPELRGVIPLDAFHVPRSLQRFLKKNPFTVTANHAFNDVIRACADRDEDTWINDDIIRLYGELHAQGFAHSIECWQEEKLAGGLYGVSLGGAFFGESMFSRASNASKVALVELVGRLRQAGYVLLDTQFTNDHLEQFGVVEISRKDYKKRLKDALKAEPQPCF